ncbi:transcription factor MYB2-like [Zingiber officinale]|uniref:MYB protein n=1 Tax=Zingiber officinale TaxID=94328 RepID=A0A8J5LNZ7_ZINOF|nr:transcription factor MYB2-like [Zingiber officinale]KAG6520215.1 hypothetical protein ZIOFF_017253 [Zingiber officinale]WLQ69478.1 MYB protein [Zingiber officinale]
MEELRRGPWTVDEDLLLVNYVSQHGEGRWNALARSAGLKRTGKSCRLRWLNYLRPDLRRGNITPQEQLLIIELHSRWGNRWSKIARLLPGRTDNEIKNYWRTRVQRRAKQLRCDADSEAFKEETRRLWIPRLLERIQAASAVSTASASSSSSAAVPWQPEPAMVTMHSASGWSEDCFSPAPQLSPFPGAGEMEHLAGSTDVVPGGGGGWADCHVDCPESYDAGDWWLSGDYLWSDMQMI